MSNLFAQKRSAITRTMAIVLALVLVVAIVAGEEVLSNANKSNGNVTGIDLHIYEDNPVLQLDHYYPDTIYVPLGANVFSQSRTVTTRQGSTRSANTELM